MDLGLFNEFIEWIDTFNRWMMYLVINAKSITYTPSEGSVDFSLCWVKNTLWFHVFTREAVSTLHQRPLFSFLFFFFWRSCYPNVKAAEWGEEAAEHTLYWLGTSVEAVVLHGNDFETMQTTNSAENYGYQRSAHSCYTQPCNQCSLWSFGFTIQGHFVVSCVSWTQATDGSTKTQRIVYSEG